MFRSIALAAAMTLPVIITGCTARVGVGYRTYDPYYHDYHVYGPGESVYYNQWLVETHHPHRDYRHLDKHDRQKYWEWRHHHR